jgi:hypothetical protein
MSDEIGAQYQVYPGDYSRDRAKGVAAAWILSIAVGAAGVIGWFVVPRVFFADWPFRRTITLVSTLACLYATMLGLKRSALLEWSRAGNRAARWQHNRELARIVRQSPLDADALRRAKRHIYELRRHSGKADAEGWERTLGLSKVP